MFPSNFTHYAIASVGLHLASPYKLAATMGPLRQPFKQGLNIGYFKYVFASLNREWAEWVWGYNAAQRLWITTHRTKHQTGLPKFKYRLHPEVAVNPIEMWLCEDPSAPKRPHHGTWICTFTYVDLRWATYGQRWYLKRTEHRDGHIEWTEERAEENEQYYEVVEYPHNQWGVPAFVSRGRGAFVGEAGVQYGYDVEWED